MAFLVSLIFLLALAFIWVWRRHAQMAKERLWQIRWPLFFMFGLAAWQMLQLMPLSENTLRVFSPMAWQVHAASGGDWTLSLDPLRTQVSSMLTLSYITMFVLVVLLVRDQKTLARFVLAMVVLGVFQALLAILLYSTQASYSILFLDVVHDRAKGSFGYHNHFAGYLELCLSLGVGLLLAKMIGGSKTCQREPGHVPAILRFVLSPEMRLRLMLIVMVTALVLTRSRMGNAGFFAALLITGLLAVWVFYEARAKLVLLVASLIVIDLVLIGSWVGVDRVLDRVQGTELLIEDGGTQESVEQRQLAAMHAVGMVHDYPMFGVGAGGFSSAFGPYQAPGDLFFDHAHNDYVQWVAEHGWGGFIWLAGFLFCTWWVCLDVLRNRRSSLPRGVAMAVLMASLCMAIHSTVDFNLQLPANALTLMCILGLAWVAKLSPSIQGSQPNDQGRGRPPVNVLG
jgi:O-antigen ligase